MIRVFDSILTGDPAETHYTHGVTVADWLRGQTSDYRPGDRQPLACVINGQLVQPTDWETRVIGIVDIVDFRVLPRASWAAIAMWTCVAVSVGMGIYMALSIPNTTSAKGTNSENILQPNAKANTAKLGGVVPELFGRYIRYPDYLSQPRRYFVDTTTQALDLLLCVGVGEYTISEDNLKIGETPFSSLGQSIDYELFGPGEDVSGHQAHQNWYNAPEVGGTTGSSGLRLKAAAVSTQSIEAQQFDFDGDEVTVPYGAGDVPEDWAVDTLLQIVLPESVTVTDSGQDLDDNYLPDVLTGAFRDFVADDAVTIAGHDDLEGDYYVATVGGTPPDADELTLLLDDSTPATFLPAGSYDLDIDYTGARYRIDEILIEIISVGGSPMARRKGFSVTRLNPDGTEDMSWSGFATESRTDAQVVIDEDSMNGDWAGPFLACPEGETTEVIEWDVFAPQGLAKVKDSGSLRTRNVTVQLQYREAGTSDDWISIDHEISGKTRDQLGWTFTETLPAAITPEVRVRRLSAEKTSVKYMDRVEWYGLRSQLSAVTSYAGVTVLALTLQGSDTIASQTENRVNVVATRKLAPLGGGTPVACRDIAPVAAYIAQSLGYSDSQLDMAEFQRLHAIWVARGDTFDFVFDDETVARDAINTTLQAGFAEMTVDTGAIRPVRDEARSTYEQGYSPENMREPLRRTFESRQPDEPDGIEIEYMDADTWSKETVLCLLPDDAGDQLEKIKLDGVTDRTRAWRIGMRRRRAQRYRRWTYEFGTELDALNSSYLSYVPLVDDIPGYGKVAILRAMTACDGDALLTVSEPMEWIDGETHVVAYREADGTVVGPFSATAGGSEYEIIADIPQPWPDLTARQEPPHVYFGTSARWSFPALITEIKPSGPLAVDVTATNYDSRVYADDDNSPED